MDFSLCWRPYDCLCVHPIHLTQSERRTRNKIVISWWTNNQKFPARWSFLSISRNTANNEPFSRLHLWHEIKRQNTMHENNPLLPSLNSEEAWYICWSHPRLFISNLKLADISNIYFFPFLSQIRARKLIPVRQTIDTITSSFLNEIDPWNYFTF